MQLLIDTEATTTFINKKTLNSIKQYTYINKHSDSFVLADGIAPFHVLGVVELQISFSNQITKIHVHVAYNLCNINNYNPMSYATMNKMHSSTGKDLYALTKNIQINQHQNDLLKLIFRFNKLFDTTKHNIANTPIHHVINTIPHSPPAYKSSPQPDKEEIMYTMITGVESAVKKKNFPKGKNLFEKCPRLEKWEKEIVNRRKAEGSWVEP